MLIQLLPLSTLPPDEALGRRHLPRPIKEDYTVFRSCLRWEFGFTCAICLLHERDIVQTGVEGWGPTQIEHIVPQSTASRGATPGVVHKYSNLLYICRLCNNARGDTDVVDVSGRRLLDPTRDNWSQHFELVGDQLSPMSGDGDAAYTADAYAINDPRKVGLRRRRRQTVGDLVENLKVMLRRRDRPDGLEPGEPARLARQLGVWAWIPEDPPADCRCALASARTLPAPYQRQVVAIEVPETP